MTGIGLERIIAACCAKDYVIFDSFNRAPGAIGRPEMGSFGKMMDLQYIAGHAISSDTAWLLTEGTTEDYKLSIEMCLEQKPEDWEKGAIRRCGVVFDFYDKNDFDFHK